MRHTTIGMYFPVNRGETGTPCIIVWPDGDKSLADAIDVPANCWHWRCAKRRPRHPDKIVPKAKPMAFIAVDTQNTAPLLLLDALTRVTGIGA